MPDEKKGITVKIDAELHAQVREYVESHGMTMAEFVSQALDNELHPKFQMKEMQTMMEDTAAKNGFQPRQKSYYRAVLEGLGQAARLYIAELEGTPVAGAMTVVFGETCSFFYSCSAKGSEKTHANELLQWRMQTDALRLGCTRFDFRGVIGYPDESNPHLGLHSYKRGFGAEFRAYIGQLDLPLRPWLYALSTRLCMSHAASLAAVSPAVSFLTTL